MNKILLSILVFIPFILCAQLDKDINGGKQITGCKKMKKGEFYHVMPDGEIMTIKRTKKYQFEYYKGATTKYKIEWIDECTYTLEMLKTNLDFVKELQDKILTVNIYEVTKNYYKYVCQSNVDDFKTDGIILLLK